jgi:ATP-dependent NAD(P)H-hydrate dehydratase
MYCTNLFGRLTLSQRLASSDRNIVVQTFLRLHKPTNCAPLQATSFTVVAMDTAAATSPKETALFSALANLVPPLAPERYKGQAGKVAVIGGCREYTGAPFFASYAALKIGADLSHVFCTNGAATVIKSYSPELIVHPYLLDSEDVPPGSPPLSDKDQGEWREHAVQAVARWLDRFDVVVVGPGLGRNELVLSTVEAILKEAIQRRIPLVIDADGLFVVTQKPELLQGYRHAILTPNAAEFRRLAAKLKTEEGGQDRYAATKALAKGLQGPIVVAKGAQDVISDGTRVVSCSIQGSLRRAGGQGDVTSGAIATFVAWAQAADKTSNGLVCIEDDDSESVQVDALLVAAYGGCATTRLAARRAFKRKGRAMGATDLLEDLGLVVDEDICGKNGGGRTGEDGG